MTTPNQDENQEVSDNTTISLDEKIEILTEKLNKDKKKSDSPGGPKHRKRTWFGRLKRKYHKTWYWTSIIVTAILLSTLIKLFAFQTFYVPSQSMTNTLEVGDRIIASKISYYTSDPKPGDIIVFKDPGGWLDNSNVPQPNILQKGLSAIGLLPSSDKEFLVKRIIAVGGEKVKCCSPSGNILVSDDDGKTWKELFEPYINSELEFDPNRNIDTPNITPDELSARAFPTITVPLNHYFVLGDNRANSKDSLWHYRFEFNGNATLSTVPRDNIVGKVTNIVWPKAHWKHFKDIDLYNEN